MNKKKKVKMEWIDEIPEKWNVQALKTILNERNSINKNSEETNLLSLTISDGVIPYSEKKTGGNKAKEDFSKYKIVKKEDLVINSMNVVVGASGVSKYDGLVSPVYYVFYEKPNISDIRYYYYLFQTSSYQNHLFGLGNGIMVKISDDQSKMNTIRKKIPIEKLKSELIILPSIVEQNRIVNYLDKQCSKIDKIIEDNKKEIELLEEYKKNYISKIVLRGLDKNAEFKNSGEFFIGQIPKNWKVRRLKYVAEKIFKGAGITKDDVVENGDTCCIRYGEIYTKYNYFFKKCLTKTNLEKINSKQYISYGDILFVGTGELVEEIGKNIAYLGNDKCLAGGDIIVVRHKENPLFMTFALNSHYCQEQKSNGKAKLKVVHIYSTEIGNIKIALPPIEEQNEIANNILNTCKNIDKIKDYRQQIINKLEEYKKSLIYEVVTGKKEIC